MKATQHPSNNRVLGAPNGWDQDALAMAALAITDVTIEGMPAVQSWWRPSKAELEALNAGALIRITMLGTKHPPIAVDAQ